MRTPRRTPDDAGAPAQPPTAARGRRAHAGRPADETASRERSAGTAFAAFAPSDPAAPDPAAFTPDTPQEPHAPGAPAEPAALAARAGQPAGDRPPGQDDRPRSRPQGGDGDGGGGRGGGGGGGREGLGGGLRPRTVRAKIVSLLMVPVVSLLALWGFATVTTAQDIARLRLLRSVDADVRQPVTAAIAALQDERSAAVRQTAAPGTGRAAELKERVGATDAAITRLRLGDRHTVGDNGSLPADVATRVTAFVVRTEGLSRLRAAAAAGRADGDQIYEEYTATVSAGFAVVGALAGIEDTGGGAEARVLLELGRAGEMLAREDALLGSAHLTGQLDAERLREFAGAVVARHTLTEAATADLPAPQRAAWRNLTAQPAYRQLSAAEERVRAAAPGRPAAQAVPSGEWDAAHSAVREGIAAVETAARSGAGERHEPLGGGVFSAGGAAVLLGLAAVATSLVISVRIGRGLVVELVSLRNGALEIARRKLPAAMRRLRAGEEIDVLAEAPPGPAPQDEIGQVGEALTTVHRAALSAAVERAELASGISGVFVNLARRSQVLVHRQLNLLDSMERRADDPNELGDLFRLDHLTTRMRRHAESLIILSGAAPGRAWRMPVPLTNVVRAAVSEIEDYARVEVRRLPETAVVGGAVADLTHLLAELIENAAQFSPPHTKVRVSGEPVGNGYALEIEDRGLGMGKESLAEANARITQSEALDLFDSDRLGLFVVSRLSSRHDIKVHLRTSPYGGTTAVVLLPTDLLQSALPPGRGAAGAAPSRDPGPPAHAATAPAPAPGSGAGVGVGAGSGAGLQASRPPRVPALTPPREPDRPPAGVTALRRRTPPSPPAPPTSATSSDPRGAEIPQPARTSQSQSQPQPQPQAQAQSQAQSPEPSESSEHPQRPQASQASQAMGAHGGDMGADLPRRVRQASLVPQLREAPAPGPYAADAPADGPGERTPEQVRDRMSAYRDGWRRGGGPAPGTPIGTRRPLGTGYGPQAPSDPGSEGDDE
ncbi:nitrate- and nitrite sensing domain-containing protein [Streptomyces sp. NPDC012769]|uniref:sensor histidine kinase n=1 Tax=Streptomyces sp. NPDC012769 TaxID=3364848 RepID=UPI0036C8B7A4